MNPGWLVALSFVFLLGCSSSPPYELLRVQLPDGGIIECEVPTTSEGMRMGLMYRDELCSSCGMLFRFSTVDRHSFWMKNMKIPIDIVYIGSDWRVVGIARDLPPCKEDPCEKYVPNSPANYVLELNANSTREHKIFIGSEIKALSDN